MFCSDLCARRCCMRWLETNAVHEQLRNAGDGGRWHTVARHPLQLRSRGTRMSNRDVESAWSYHNGTKHSFSSIRTDPHPLDWANKPLLFKLYPTLEPFVLPRDFSQTG